MYEIIYDVDYAPNEKAVKISELMSSLGLGIEGISMTGQFIFKTTTKPTKAYLKKLEEQIPLAISAGGGLAYDIRFIKSYKLI